MLDHWGSQSQTLDGMSSSGDHGSGSRDEDKLTPITNWAHLSYIKNQRNNLRAELKAHQIAGAEAKQSVTSTAYGVPYGCQHIRKGETNCDKRSQFGQK